MTIGKTIRKALKELSDGILGMIGPKDFKITDDNDIGQYIGLKRDKKPKRARTKSGKYKADDKKTKDVNEAWVGGKAPKKKAKRKTKGKK
jgi:hypothetical protein